MEEGIYSSGPLEQLNAVKIKIRIKKVFSILKVIRLKSACLFGQNKSLFILILCFYSSD